MPKPLPRHIACSAAGMRLLPRSGWIHCVLTSLFLAAQGSALHAGDLALTWDPSPDPDTIGYAVYYGDLTGTDVYRVEAPVQQSATLTDLVPGTTYFIYVVAIGSLGQESVPSNTLHYVVGASSSAPQDSASTNPPANPPADQSTNPPANPPADQSANPPAADVTADSWNSPFFLKTVETQAGQQYKLSFNLSAFSPEANPMQCSLDLTVSGQELLLDQPISVTVPSNGDSWGAESVTFTADSDSATVQIQTGLATPADIQFKALGFNLTIQIQ